jgi:hypothetical protein
MYDMELVMNGHEYKLMTWEQFEKTFKPIAVEWKESYDIDSNNDKVLMVKVILANGMGWNISQTSIEKFGTKIRAISTKNTIYAGNKNFTHVGMGRIHLYHKSWFVMDDFLTEQDMEI